MGELQPRMRAGDKDRQRVVEQLGKHMGEGRLTVQEFDERIVRAHASVYLDELPALTADLPEEPRPQHTPRRPSVRLPGGGRPGGGGAPAGAPRPPPALPLAPPVPLPRPRPVDRAWVSAP